MDRDPEQQLKRTPSTSKHPRLSIETEGYCMRQDIDSTNTWVWRPKAPTPRCTLRHDPFPLWQSRTDKQEQQLKPPTAPPADADSGYEPARSEQQFSDWKDSWQAKMTKAIADGLEDGEKLLNFMYDYRSPSPDTTDSLAQIDHRRSSLPEITPFSYYASIVPRCDSAPPSFEDTERPRGDWSNSRPSDYLNFLNEQPEIVIKHERDDVYISVKSFKPKKSQPVRIRIE